MEPGFNGLFMKDSLCVTLVQILMYGNEQMVRQAQSWMNVCSEQNVPADLCVLLLLFFIMF